jgi:sugar phosphate isomerase/epimerase
MNPPPTPLRFGYCTNGFAHHRLEDVLVVLADLGYDGVALTLDHSHFDPYADDLSQRIDDLARRLTWYGLAVTIETGSPYVLDPWGRGLPTLMEDAYLAADRIDLLQRSVRIAGELGASTVQLASGPAVVELPERAAWQRLVAHVESVLTTAEEYGVSLAFEPQPGMFIDTVERCLELSERLGGHDLFGITFDIGSAYLVQDTSVPECLRRAAPRLRHVQISDMRDGNRQHLEFGAGDIEFPPVLATLRDIGYNGLISVEIPGGSLDATDVARRSVEFLWEAAGHPRLPSRSASSDFTAALENQHLSGSLTSLPPFLSALCTKLEVTARAWLDRAVFRIAADPAAIGTLFPDVGRRCGQLRLQQNWTVDEAARVLLLTTLSLDRSALGDTLAGLYEDGGPAERRAVLLALPLLDGVDREATGRALADAALPLVREALRSKDSALIEAAMGPYAAAHLPDTEYRQAVLTCVAHDVPLSRIPCHDGLMDPELAIMLADFAHKRLSAGLEVPTDIRSVLAGFPDIVEKLTAKPTAPACLNHALPAPAASGEDT